MTNQACIVRAMAIGKALAKLTRFGAQVIVREFFKLRFKGIDGLYAAPIRLKPPIIGVSKNGFGNRAQTDHPADLSSYFAAMS